MKYLKAILYYAFKPVPGEVEANLSGRQHVNALKAKGGGGVSFDCDGYRVEIYEPGTDMRGPWPA